MDVDEKAPAEEQATETKAPVETTDMSIAALRSLVARTTSRTDMLLMNQAVIMNALTLLLERPTHGGISNQEILTADSMKVLVHRSLELVKVDK